MSRERLVLCGDLDEHEFGSGSSICLNLHGQRPNVRLQIEDIGSRFLTDTPPVLADLLELATYVYAADSSSGRGGKTDAHMAASWRRDFRFVVPVRNPELWSSANTTNALVETLGFLSDDNYAFEFRQLRNAVSASQYLEFPTTSETSFQPDEMLLFSGGLDSLAGTVEQLVHQGKKLALVSHRSASKIASAQMALVEDLRKRFGRDRILHIPVWANLLDGLGKEPTHRSRSFLFAALGALVARLFGLDRLRFYENGVVSLNLPILPQVVGARATRTTHPKVLAGFQAIFSAVLNKDFIVENPFAWCTKAEVVQKIADGGCADLIRHTRSCTRVHDMTKLHPHCGRCSQCIDRRFGILASGLAAEDPEEGYDVELFTGGRPAGPDREMAMAYVRSASEIRQMSDIQFVSKFGEISRVIPHCGMRSNIAASKICELYQRHAVTVCDVFDRGIALHAPELRDGSLPPDSLLHLVIGSRQDSASYPKPPAQLSDPTTKLPVLHLALDENRSEVHVDSWGIIRGANAKLILALAPAFRKAARAEMAAKNYPLIKPLDLINLLGLESDEALRKRIDRCRKAVRILAIKAGIEHPPIDALIENVPWHGYRLNPDRLRIITLSELMSLHSGRTT